MFTRVGGTTLALAAAVALALSIAGAMGTLPGWWSGHPNVQGTLLKSKQVDIGLLETRGCNTGGDMTCQDVGVSGTVATTGYVAAGASGLLAFASLLLALTIAVQSERRKSIAKLAVFAVVVAGIVAIALILQGPGIEARTSDNRLLQVTVPLGLGTYLFAGGMMSSIVASVLALRPTTAPRVRLPRAVARQVGTGPADAMPAQPVDVLALLQDDALRPAALGPEPMMGRPSSPGPPGSAAYMGPTSPNGQPLFSAAPQLRPLYEAAPDLGGTGGFIPRSSGPTMMRPPTPIPLDQVRALAGLPTPPPFDIPEPARRGSLAFAATAPDLGPGVRDPLDLPPLADTPVAFAPPPRAHSPSRPPELPSAAIPAAVPHEPSSRRVSMALGAPPAPAASPPWAVPGSPGAPAAARPAPAPPAPEPRPKTLPPPIRSRSVSSPPPSGPARMSSPPMPAALAPAAQPRTSAVAPAAPPPAGAAVPVASPGRSPASAPIPRPVANAGSSGAVRPAPGSKPPPTAAAGPAPAPGVPFVPTVPFPAPSTKARHARPPTDPIERASTQSFEVETQERERHEDSLMARLRAEGDATGVMEPSSEFESLTAEERALGSRAVTDADDLIETGSLEKVNPTELDLPLVKPPGGAGNMDDEDDSGGPGASEDRRAAVATPTAATPTAPAESDDDAPKPRQDRLARGLRAFGIKPTERDETGMFKLGRAPSSAPERPETSPLIPPPTPSPPPRAATPRATTPAAAAAPAAATPAAAAASLQVPMSTAPSSLPPPSEKQSATSGPSPACPQCESPMAWVEEHLRFYCKSCKMYF